MRDVNQARALVEERGPVHIPSMTSTHIANGGANTASRERIPTVVVATHDDLARAKDAPSSLGSPLAPRQLASIVN
jgi:hypothetical protein